MRPSPAQASTFGVEIRVVDDDVLVEVTDNGSGFDVEAAGSTGHGLTNMRNRAEKLGGTFELFSTPAEGTRLIWIAPV